MDAVRDKIAAHGWSLDELSETTGPHPSMRPVWFDPNQSLTIRRAEDGAAFVLSFWDGVDILVDPRARRLGLPADWRRHDSATLAHLLLDQALPRALSQDGPLVLHGGGVRLDGGAIVLLGPSGRGKSTLTAALAAAGGTILNDDALLVEEGPGGPTARAVYPGLRLLPDSVAALFPPRAGGTPVAGYSTKRRLDLEVATDAAPVAIALLALLGDDRPVAVRPLLRLEACMTLLTNSFALDPGDPRQAAARMAACGRIAEAVPAVTLDYPRSYEALPDVAALLRGLAAGGAAPAAAHAARRAGGA